MAKEELLEMRGQVVELLPNAMFRVRLENDHEILGAHSANWRKMKAISRIGLVKHINSLRRRASPTHNRAQGERLSARRFVQPRHPIKRPSARSSNSNCHNKRP